jgi:hypothetical protein
VTRRRLRFYAALAIGLAVILWIGQAVVGLTYYDEQESYPWFLRAVQWVALTLVLVSLPLLFWAMAQSGARRGDI